MKKIKLFPAIILFNFIIIIPLLFLFTNNVSSAPGIPADNVKIHYFYSPTCASCQETDKFFDTFTGKYKNVIIEEHNIAALRDKSLLDKYNELYNVNKNEQGIVPVVFIRNIYISGEQEIMQHLEEIITDASAGKTLEVIRQEENHERDRERFLGYKVLGVFAAGLLNGVNPCSLSMLLFFISMLSVKKGNIMGAGISFSAGKFISFLLLGTVLFNLLGTINTAGFFAVIKAVMLVVALALTALNLNDCYAARNEQYGRIKVQLPLFLRKANHKLLSKILGISASNLLIMISFILGFIITFGEFLCTGQIYLATIVTILQSGESLNFRALIYLLVYDLSYITPILVLTWIIYKGKEVFDVSEEIRAKLPLIKLANALIFLLFSILLLFML